MPSPLPLLLLAAAAAAQPVQEEEDRTVVITGEQTGDGAYTVRSTSTATRLPLSIRETPQSVTVVTRQRIDDLQMTGITDVVKATPGLFLNTGNGPGRPAFNARGFDIDNIMYDGLPARYQGHIAGLQANLAIFERVEVVRGATGLITGSGNPSAAINMVRKRPLREFHINLTAAAGSWDNYRGEIDMGGAVNAAGTLRVRTIGSYQDMSTFRTGEKIHRGLFHAIAEVDAGPDTLVTVGATHQDDFYNSFWGGLPLSATGAHMNLPRSIRPSNDWEAKIQKAETLFGELRQGLGNDWSLRLAAAKTWQDAVFSGTYLYRRSTDLSLTQSAFQGSYDEDQTSADLYASGPVTLLGRAHDLTFGASRRETRTRTQNYSGSGELPGSIDIFNFDPATSVRPNFVATTASTNVISQNGVYASARLNPADPLKIILGGRLDWYEYDNLGTSVGDYRVNAHKTYYAGVLLDLDRHHTLYASYTNIFQPQSARGFAADAASQTILPPVLGKNYEVGLKGEYLGGKLNTTLTLFQVDQTNRAIVPVDQAGCPTFPAASCAIPAGLVRSRGIDAEIQGEPLPGWQLSAGYSYVQARYVEGLNPTNESRVFDTDYPEHMVKLSSTYTLPGKLDRFRLGASLYWQSRIYNQSLRGANFNNVAFLVEQAPYAVADMMAAWKIDARTELQVNVNNLFDKHYYKAIGYDIRWGSTEAYGDPRNVMATLRTRL